MESFNLLGEVAIGVTGFAGVVVALRARDGVLGLAERVRVGALLSTSAITAFLSLLPDGLALADFDPSRVWLLSSLAFTVFVGINLVTLVYIGYRVPEELQRDGGMANPSAIAGVVLMTSAILLQAYNFLGSPTAWPLYFGLSLLIVWSLILFIREVTGHTP